MSHNSQKAGCMRRLPASHSCHPRSVQWMSAAASVCESPAASRAARTSAGAGFAAGPFGPRFGWLLIDFDFFGIEAGITDAEGFRMAGESVPALDLDAGVVSFGKLKLGISGPSAQHFGREVIAAKPVMRTEEFGDFVESDLVNCAVGVGGHFLLQPLFFPRRGGLRCATHELNYIRNACNVKNYFQQFSRRSISPHNK